ncbi:CinA family protein [Natronospirillum operosum]|uniref:CinA family protein n=1 Tax=Natronospirillum operosum TaxID=2759953 RepID=A0A4Z0WDR9_9GAMM|nr:CinA family protein [Natronospirillum operosum]TGG95150.1 CinA family protein [Natronospirillum operosum]
MNKPFDDPGLQARAEALAERLQAQNLTMATAESCTGGWIGKVCTDLPGSSRWYTGGIVSYSNAAKVRLLRVSEMLLVEQGAVSQLVAEAMAQGAREALGSHLAVAVTGVAGPDGGSAEKPVGTVWLAWADQQQVRSQRVLLAGDRETIRRQTVALALEGMLPE